MVRHEGTSMGFNVDQASERAKRLEAIKPFFHPVSLNETRVDCGDKRTGQAIHLFGGAAKVAFILAMLEGTLSPRSSAADFALPKSTFALGTASIVPVLRKMGINPGLHSDTLTEGGPTVSTARLAHDDIGCKYLKFRRQISSGMANNSERILSRATDLRPELFIADNSRTFARIYMQVNGKVASDGHYFDRSGGRDVFKAGLRNGATPSVVEELPATVGAAFGVINLDREHSADLREAALGGFSFFEDDAGAFEDIMGRLSHIYPYSKDHIQIANTLDELATFDAVGVPENEILVRRG